MFTSVQAVVVGASVTVIYLLSRHGVMGQAVAGSPSIVQGLSYHGWYISASVKRSLLGASRPVVAVDHHLKEEGRYGREGSI